MKTKQENLVRAAGAHRQCLTHKRYLFLVADTYFTLSENNAYYICCMLYKYMYGIIGEQILYHEVYSI